MTRAFSKRHFVIRLLQAGVAMALAAVGPSSHAQSTHWPEKPITIIVPYAAGGGTDALARLMGKELSAQLRQSVVVDNKPGARGAVAYQALLRSANDGGYTYVLDNSSFAVQPLYKGLPYDPLTAFSPVARITISPTVLLISKELPVQSFKEFVAYARRNAGKLSYASFGVGSSSHLSGELMNSLTSINMLHVPYKGSGPALTDLLGGQVQVMFSDPLSAKPLVDAGKVKAIAISGYERWKAYPDTPTYRELALEQMTSPGWWGLLASGKTPREITEKMAVAVKTVLTSASVKAQIRELGAEVSPLGPTEFAEFVKADTNRWASVVRLGNIDLDSGAR